MKTDPHQVEPSLQLEKRRMPAWLKYGTIAVIAVGIFLRFYGLGQKVYWIDETNSSLRTLGYTRSELIATAFTGEVVSVEQLRQFQTLDPDRGWDDTWTALTGTAEHTPLYFLLSRAWIGVVGHSPAAMRFLTALFSVLMFPCLYWLCLELFGSATVGAIAMALVAVSPIHVLYAQEARPYSLISVWVLLSSTLLLRAMRLQTPASWVGYSLTVIAGLYTQLLFSLVAVAHGLYAVAIQGWQKSRPVLIALGAACLSLIPWLLLLVHHWQQVKYSTRSLRENIPTDVRLDRWLSNINQTFLNQDLGTFNLLLVVLIGVSLYFLYRNTPRRTWLFVFLLVGVPFLLLVIPDLLWGGQRSSRIRYLFPSILGIQIAFAYLFATQAVWVKTWPQKCWRFLLIFLLATGLAGGMVNAQAVVPWSKSLPRSSYYLPTAAIVNQSANPLIISDGPVTDTLAFSAWLKPDVKLQLAEDPRQIKVARGFDTIYLLNPSEQLQRILTRRGFELTVLYEDNSDPTEPEQRLWSAKRR